MAWRVTRVNHALLVSRHPDAICDGRGIGMPLPAFKAQRWISESSLMMQTEPSVAGVASV